MIRVKLCKKRLVSEHLLNLTNDVDTLLQAALYELASIDHTQMLLVTQFEQFFFSC